MGMSIDYILGYLSVACKTGFLLYACLTMYRVNAYIKEHKDGDDD